MELFYSLHNIPILYKCTNYTLHYTPWFIHGVHHHLAILAIVSELVPSMLARLLSINIETNERNKETKSQRKFFYLIQHPE